MMKTLKTMLVSLLMVGACVANTKAVGTITRDGGKKNVLTVYVDDDANTYLKSGWASGWISYKNLAHLKATTSTAMTWGMRAKKHKLSVRKHMVDFTTKTELDRQGIDLSFISNFNSNAKYKGAALIIEIQDFDNMFKEERVILTMEETKELWVLLGKVGETVNVLRKHVNKADSILK